MMSGLHKSSRSAGVNIPVPPDIKQDILASLARNKLRTGDYINIVQIEYEMTGLGIAKHEFCRGIVQLLDQGLFAMAGNSFYLTAEGFAAMPRL